MTQTVLSIHQLTKKFGNQKAVDNLSLEVKTGMILGILGPNGSGKTTTLAVILGLLNPSSGTFQWKWPLPQHKINQKIGSLLEKPNFYPYLNAIQNLRISCTIKEKILAPSASKNVLKQVGLWDARKKPYKQYSLGMKQRLAIASVLIPDPEILILDEPTNGLDPKGIAEVRELILDLAKAGKTIILASHILFEIQQTCTHVIILKEGKSRFFGDISQILYDQKQFKLKALHPKKLEELLKKDPRISRIRIEENKLKISCSSETTGEDLNTLCFKNGIVLAELTEINKSLEEHYLESIES